ncbi:MAG: CAP domain-containing protein [Thalassobaculaceae bacterium]|nr:CAP domain-containing protein [Thalassobaculaceae bacterium]
MGLRPPISPLRGLVWVALVLCALVASLPALADAPAELIRELNEDRRQRGLPALVEHPALMQAARAHVGDMAARGYVNVTAPDGVSADTWLKRVGFQATGFSAMAMSGLPEAWGTAGTLLNAEAMSELLLAPGEVRIGIGYHEKMFRLADGRITAAAWSVIVAAAPPPPIAHAVPDLLREINRARARLGAAPVRLNDALSRVAAGHADDMVRRAYFAHESPDGGTLVDRIKMTDYDFERVGENLAAGQESPAHAVKAWHESRGHAEILYAREFEEVGLAYRKGPIPQGVLTIPHVWVAVFGKR